MSDFWTLTGFQLVGIIAIALFGQLIAYGMGWCDGRDSIRKQFEKESKDVSL